MTTTTTDTVRDAARAYLRRGIHTVPVRGKQPWDFARGKLRDGWEQLRVTDAGIDALFPVGANLGVLTGEPSGGLVDADLDCPEARAAATILLPPTGSVSGRRSAPDSHYWYVVENPPNKASEFFIDPVSPTRAKLLELRSTGGQTVAPPSVYPADPEKGHPIAEPCV
jgi:hypothetical protein